MDKSKNLGKRYEAFERGGKPATSSDRLLPGEEPVSPKALKYADQVHIETDEDTTQAIFRMSKKRKALLTRYFSEVLDQNFSAGMREVIKEYMENHNII